MVSFLLAFMRKKTFFSASSGGHSSGGVWFCPPSGIWHYLQAFLDITIQGRCAIGIWQLEARVAARLLWCTTDDDLVQMLTVPMMGNPDPEAEVKEDQTVYEGLVNRELPIITYLDDPPLGEGLACNETEQRPSTSDASSGFKRSHQQWLSYVNTICLNTKPSNSWLSGSSVSALLWKPQQGLFHANVNRISLFSCSAVYQEPAEINWAVKFNLVSSRNRRFLPLSRSNKCVGTCDRCYDLDLLGNTLEGLSPSKQWEPWTYGWWSPSLRGKSQLASKRSKSKGGNGDGLWRALLQLGISKSVTESKMNDLKVLFFLLGGEDTI